MIPIEWVAIFALYLQIEEMALLASMTANLRVDYAIEKKN